MRPRSARAGEGSFRAKADKAPSARSRAWMERTSVATFPTFAGVCAMVTRRAMPGVLGAGFVGGSAGDADGLTRAGFAD